MPLGFGGGGRGGIVGEASVLVHPDTKGFQSRIGRDIDGAVRHGEGRILKGLGGAFMGAAKVATVAAVGIGAAVTATLGGIIGKGVSMNAELETATMMFKTLMGDADKAKDHVADLFDFAAKTPFETGPIIEASRMMRTFGGDALDTMENLEMVGDAAAATGQEINEVGFWVGRAYSMIQAGKPFGEAAMRLQEMGVLSADARSRMEDLQKSGASTSEVWGVLTKDFEKFNGAMIEQATSWKGLTSTLADVVSMTAGRVTKPLFDSFKRLAGAVIDLTNTDRWAEWETRLTGVFERIAGWVDKLTGKIEGLSGPKPNEDDNFNLDPNYQGGAGSTTAAEAPDLMGGMIDGMIARKEEYQQRIVDFLNEIIVPALGRIDVGQLSATFSSMLLQMMANVPWEEVANGASQALLEAMINLDWAGLIMTAMEIFDQIVAGFLSGVIEAFLKDPMKFILGILGIILAPAKVADTVIDFLRRVPLVGKFMGWIVEVMNGVGQGVRDKIGDMFKRAFGFGTDSAATEVGGLRGKILAKIGAAGEWLVGIGKSIMDGLLRGISTAWNNVASYLSGIAARIKALKGPIDKDRKMLEPEGQAVMQGFLRGIERYEKDLDDKMRSITRRVSDFGSFNLDEATPALARAAAASSTPVNGSTSDGYVQPVVLQIGEHEIGRVLVPIITAGQKANGINNRTIFGELQKGT